MSEPPQGSHPLTVPSAPALPGRCPAGPAAHRRDPSEPTLAWFGLLSAVGLLLAARTLSIQAGEVTVPLLKQPLPSVCLLRRLTGWPCPGCGLTRALVAATHGEGEAAWRYNPAGSLLCCLLAVQIPLSLVQLGRWFTDRPLLTLLPWYRAALALWMLVLVGQWLLRLAQGRW